MMKTIRNQKGMTLLELLGALTIITIIIGVASMLLLSILGMFNSRTQSYADNSKMKVTMSTLTAELSNSTKAVYYPTNQELRYYSGIKYKSIILNTTNNELSIYDFSFDGNAANDSGHFLSSAINITTSGNLYTNKHVLTNNVASISFKQANGTFVPITPLSNGELIQIDITFNYLNVKVSGNKDSIPMAGSASIKLLIDQTAD